MPYSTANGITVYYETSGEGTPMVLLHAIPFDHSLFLYQISHFSTRFKVIAPDLRGFGRSDKLSTAFTLSDMVDDVRGVCRNENVREMILVGVSVGSRTALLLALDHPEMCKALVLVGGSSRPGKESSRYADHVRGFAEDGIDAYRARHLEDCVTDGFANSQRGRHLLQTFLERNPWLDGQAIAQVFRAFADVDASPRLATMTVPTLVINGEFDHSLPNGRRTAQMIPGATHKVLPGTGHACCIEDPAGFDVLVMEFLDQHRLLPPIEA